MAVPVRRNPLDMSGLDPVAQLERLHAQMGSLLDTWGPWSPIPELPTTGFVPRTDVEERDDAYVVELELPGVRESDVEVSLAGRRLIVSGERKEKERLGLLRRRTRSVGRFYYEVELPGDVDEDGVTASLDEGVLTVTLPKAESERVRGIKVTRAG
jgi:HSP20 family protein